MGKIKGCANEACEAHKKKITYKEAESYCSKCGQELIYVCNDCYTQLPDDTEKYCVRCHAKHEDRKAKTKKIAEGIGGGAAAIGFAVLTSGKKLLEIAKNIKG